MKSGKTLADFGRLSAWSAAAVAALFTGMSRTTAQTSGDVKVPRPLPHMEDVKTPPNGPTTKANEPMPARAPQPSRADASSPSKPPAPALAAPHTEIDHVYFDAHTDGSVWALGTAYKASFTPNGATYIPFLGSCAPTNYPVSFGLKSITVGDQAIPFDPAAEAVREGTRVVYDRGGVVELYSMKLDSVEQEFTFASLPSSGDLVVRIGVDTSLDATQLSDGLRWSNALGAVNYSRAVVVDAAGDRTPVLTERSGDAIEIRVPADVIARAAFPIVIDPVIGTFTVDSSTSDDLNPDIAFDATNRVYQVCWERAFSSADHDCYSQLQNTSGATIAGSLATIDFTSDFWAVPRTANNLIAQQFLVAAQVTPAAGGNRVIKGVTRSATSNATSSQFQISDPLITSDQFNVSVGGDPNPFAPTYYCVAWERIFTAGSDTDIFARLVLSNATLLGTSTILVDNSSSTLDANPSVSRSDGNQPATGQDWTIVWQREFSSTDHDIRGVQIHWDGTITNASFSIDASTSDDTTPAVSSVVDGSGTNRDYVVVYKRDFTTDHDIMGVLLNSATSLASADLSSVENSGNLFQDQIQPAVDSDGTLYGVTYSENFGSSTTDYDIYVSTFSASSGGFTVVDSHVNLAFSGDPEHLPQITARHSGGLASACYGVVWSDEFTATDHDVFGNQYCTRLETAYCGGGTSFLTACPCSNPGGTGRGCNNSINTGGALFTASGTSSLSSDSLHFVQQSELASSLSIFLQGNASAANGLVFGDGVRCVAGTLKRLYTHNASSGTVQAPVGGDLNVHTRSAALGDTITTGSARFYQVYYRDPNLAFCSAGFNVGNAQAVTWIP